MPGYADVLAADRRLCILRILTEPDVGGELGESSIEKSLGMWGFRARLSREVVQADLRELEKRHCVSIDYARDTYMIARITRRGVQAAEGVIEVDGVSKPQLGC